ncbi:hypothetical protein PAXRUDRAFT_806919, partial [Paxillus rubicundulus Ve08.2h10]
MCHWTFLLSCGERFQNSPDTVTRYFKQLLFFFLSSPPISAMILNDPCFHFFDQCISAVDGTHIRISSSLGKHGTMCN